MKSHSHIISSSPSEIDLSRRGDKLHIKKIMDSSVDVICTIDKAGDIIEISAASLHLWGYHPNELVHKPMLDIIVEEDRNTTLLASQSIISGTQVTNFENRVCCKNGDIIPIVWSARWDNEDQVMYCIARDAREMKRAEQELFEEQKRLKKSQEMARLGSWEYDIINKKTYWASDELYNIYGINRHEFPEISLEIFMNLVHPDDKDILEQDFSDISRLHNYYREHRIVRPDGRTVYVRQTIEVISHDGEPIILTGIVQDISDQKASEQLLLSSERRYRTLVQNGFDLICILDPEGNYLYVSDTVTRILGYSPSDLLAKNVFDFVHPDDVIKSAKSLAKLHSQPYIEDIEPFRIKNIHGEWRWLEAKGANMIHDSVIKGLVFNSRDITEKKLLHERIEKEAQEWQKKLTSAMITAQEQERTQLGRELHDNVNQMLTTVKLYTELCLESEVDTHLLLEKSAKYLSTCINEIRSISKRLSTPIIEDLSFSDSIKDLVNSLNLTDKLNITLDIKRIKWKLNHQTHLGIYRIVQEHLTNILKHAEAKNVFIDIQSSSKTLHIVIKDDGKGFRLNAKRKGIGISNMNARAASINAQIQFITTPGKGCTLELTVPINN